MKEIPAEKEKERETGMQCSKNTVIVKKKKTLVETYFTYYKLWKQLTEVYIFHVYTSIHVNIYKKKSQQKNMHSLRYSIVPSRIRIENIHIEVSKNKILHSLVASYFFSTLYNYY